MVLMFLHSSNYAARLQIPYLCCAFVISTRFGCSNSHVRRGRWFVHRVGPSVKVATRAGSHDGNCKVRWLLSHQRVSSLIYSSLGISAIQQSIGRADRLPDPAAAIVATPCVRFASCAKLSVHTVGGRGSTDMGRSVCECVCLFFIFMSECACLSLILTFIGALVARSIVFREDIRPSLALLRPHTLSQNQYTSLKTTVARVQPHLENASVKVCLERQRCSLLSV